MTCMSCWIQDFMWRRWVTTTLHVFGIGYLVTQIWLSLNWECIRNWLKVFQSWVSTMEGFCDGYRKSHTLPFDLYTSQCKTHLEWIHIDVMGLTRTLSCSGSPYMLLFIDDFSRFTWIYIIKHKSEVVSQFQEFKVIVEGKLSRKIRILRTNNVGQITSNNFFSFCR